jgi:hypothetical protein
MVPPRGAGRWRAAGSNANVTEEESGPVHACAASPVRSRANFLHLVYLDRIWRPTQNRFVQVIYQESHAMINKMTLGVIDAPLQST